MFLTEPPVVLSAIARSRQIYKKCAVRDPSSLGNRS